MADKVDRPPTQRTREGHEIPIPRRSDFLRDLAKVAKPRPKPKDADEPKSPD